MQNFRFPVYSYIYLSLSSLLSSIQAFNCSSQGVSTKWSILTGLLGSIIYCRCLNFSSCLIVLLFKKKGNILASPICVFLNRNCLKNTLDICFNFKVFACFQSSSEIYLLLLFTIVWNTSITSNTFSNKHPILFTCICRLICATRPSFNLIFRLLFVSPVFM